MKTVTIHHSPDADDAFMFYGLSSGKVGYPGYVFRHELSDIESLNHLALEGKVEVTAISVHAYPYLKDCYAILMSGASMGGQDYGPRLVARSMIDLQRSKPLTIAIPGNLTSATLALKIFLREQGLTATLVTAHFDKIQDAVKKGEVDAGIIIHEGQITHQQWGLVSILDLGAWWWNTTGLPLPLGVNIVKRDLGEDAMQAVGTILRRSIEYSLSHREDALRYALSYGRGISFGEADTFVGMYVNEKTLDLGEDGMNSIKLFLGKGLTYGFIPEAVDIHFLKPIS